MSDKQSKGQLGQRHSSLIIKALVMSNFCSTVWSNTSVTNIKKLGTVQNFACRILTKIGRYDHVTPALREIGWLPVHEHLNA